MCKTSELNLFLCLEAYILTVQEQAKDHVLKLSLIFQRIFLLEERVVSDITELGLVKS